MDLSPLFIANACTDIKTTFSFSRFILRGPPGLGHCENMQDQPTTLSIKQSTKQQFTQKDQQKNFLISPMFQVR